MIKRILTVALILFSCAGRAFAADYSEEKTAVEFLRVLGIFDEIEEEEYNNQITREDFAYYLAKANRMDGSSEYRYYKDIQSDSYAFGYISDLAENGIISVPENETFRPLEYITVNEAAKMLISTLGYDQFAMANGGWPNGYCTTAEDLDIDLGKGTDVTYGEAAKMIYDCLQCPVAKINGGKHNLLTYVRGDETFLERMYDIKVGEGVVTDTSYGSIINDVPCEKGRIIISGAVYSLDENVDVKQFLGVNSKYFYNADGEDESIIFICNKKQKVTDKVINIRDFVKYANNMITYEENGRVRSVKLSEHKIIYNGVPLTARVNETMSKLNKGEIVLRSTSANSDYDLVMVTDYMNLYVGSIDPDSLSLYSGLNDGKSVNLKNCDNLTVIRNNVEAEFKNITYGMSLSVAISQNNKVCEININTSSATGILSKTDDEGVTVDGKYYRADKSYLSEIRRMNCLGLKVECILDKFGNVCYITDNSEKWTLAYLIKTVNDEDEDTVKIKVITEDNLLTVLGFAKNVKIDGARIKKDNPDKINAALELMPQKKLLQYKLNNNGEIAEMDTLYVGENEDEEHSLVPGFSEVKSRFYMADGVERYGHTAYFTSNTVTFYIPTDGDANKYVAKRGALSLGGNVMATIECYYSGKDRSHINAAVRTREAAASDSYSVMMVNSVTQGLDEDDECVYKLEGYSGATKVTYDVDTSFTQLNGLNRGDMVVIKKDNVGVDIFDVIKLYDAKTDTATNFEVTDPIYIYESTGSANIEVGNYCRGYNILFGYALRKFDTGLIAVGKDSVSSEADRLIMDKRQCVIYDFDNDEITIGDYNEIQDARTVGGDCSRVMYYLHWDDVQTCYVFNR